MTMLKPSRRDLLKLAAAMPAYALSAPLAGATVLSGAGPTHFRFDIGAMKITIVSDGHLGLPTSGLGVNADPDEVTAFLEQHQLSTTEHYSHTNHVVIETGEATVLVDVGSGSRFMPTSGRLMDNLAAAGIDTAAITHVVITHAHPDHVWGIRDDFDEPIFPDAEYIIGRTEYDYWMQDGLATSVPTEMQQFVVGAVNSLTADGLEWTMAEDGHEVVPGVSLAFTPGHTLGHMSVRIESEGKQLIALGDSMTHAYISMERPGWVSGFDMDGDLTVETRKRLLDMCASDEIAVVGYHFPFPGVGHVMRDGGAYRFVPALWQWG